MHQKNLLIRVRNDLLGKILDQTRLSETTLDHVVSWHLRNHIEHLESHLSEEEIIELIAEDTDWNK